MLRFGEHGNYGFLGRLAVVFWWEVIRKKEGEGRGGGERDSEDWL